MVSSETPKGASIRVEREPGGAHERPKLSVQSGLGLEENQKPMLFGQLIESLVAESKRWRREIVFLRSSLLPRIEKLVSSAN